MTDAPDSIFTQIIRGEIPSHKIYEDGLVFAFLDIHPVQPGHVLIVPKKQIYSLWDLPAEDYEAVMRAAQKIAAKIQEVIRPLRVGMQVLGVDVPHAHVHLIPFNTVAEFRNQPDMSAEPDHKELAAMAERLRF